MKEKKMYCDPKLGICYFEHDNSSSTVNEYQKINFYYFNDPICAHCYLLEPIILKLNYLYGEYLNINWVMGGLMETLEDMDENPEAFVQFLYYEWKKLREYSLLPLNEQIWLNDPISSSFPASQVYEIMEQLHPKKAMQFLRLARIYLFAFNKNIEKESTLIEIVEKLGLNGEDMVRRLAKQQGRILLMSDIALTEKYNVEEFPTIIMQGFTNQGIKITGIRDFKIYIDSIKRLIPNKEQIIPNQMPDLEILLSNHLILFENEIKFLYNVEFDDFSNYLSEHLNVTDYKLNNILGQNYIEKV